MFEMERFQKALGLAAVALAVIAILAPGMVAAQVPQLSQTPLPTPDATVTTGLAQLTVAAQFAGDRKPIRSGLVWRVISETADGSPPQIVARSTEAQPAFLLEPGTYILHAAYGFAKRHQARHAQPAGDCANKFRSARARSRSQARSATTRSRRTS